MIYVIGSLRNPRIPEIANALDSWGVGGFAEWFAPGARADDEWKAYAQARGQDYTTALKAAAAQHVFEFDRRWLHRCEGAVLVLPAGRSCHLELGWVLGRGQPGWVLLDTPNPDRWDVMYNFATGVARDLGELEQQIRTWEKKTKPEWKREHEMDYGTDRFDKGENHDE